MNKQRLLTFRIILQDFRRIYLIIVCSVIFVFSYGSSSPLQPPVCSELLSLGNLIITWMKYVSKLRINWFLVRAWEPVLCCKWTNSEKALYAIQKLFFVFIFFNFLSYSRELWLPWISVHNPYPLTSLCWHLATVCSVHEPCFFHKLS